MERREETDSATAAGCGGEAPSMPSRTSASSPCGATRSRSSAARGAGCVTFGPDVTRRFCEINRLRMIVRSHEVPKTMTGVQVQHDGRLITVFSASNYCGRIGNTGGTMILSPQLDYQLMEHWAPSLAELAAMEQQEAAAAAEARALAAPQEQQSRFSASASSPSSA